MQINVQLNCGIQFQIATEDLLVNLVIVSFVLICVHDPTVGAKMNII